MQVQVWLRGLSSLFLKPDAQINYGPDDGPWIFDFDHGPITLDCDTIIKSPLLQKVS